MTTAHLLVSRFHLMPWQFVWLVFLEPEIFLNTFLPILPTYLNLKLFYLEYMQYELSRKMELNDVHKVNKSNISNNNHFIMIFFKTALLITSLILSSYPFCEI